MQRGIVLRLDVERASERKRHLSVIALCVLAHVRARLDACCPCVTLYVPVRYR